jgi:hypothetical protein
VAAPPKPGKKTVSAGPPVPANAGAPRKRLEPNMTQHIEGGKWGLGELIKERRDKADITPIEVMMKLYKTVFLLSRFRR